MGGHIKISPARAGLILGIATSPVVEPNIHKSISLLVQTGQNDIFQFIRSTNITNFTPLGTVSLLLVCHYKTNATRYLIQFIFGHLFLLSHL